MKILSGAAKLAGVMGWPVTHSLSPRLHGYWLDKYGLNGAYLPLAVKHEDFTEALRALPKLGFSGVNVTVPHKETALTTVDSVSERARRIGAVNTVFVQPDGSLYGDNTDAFGFAQNLYSLKPAYADQTRPALVLGAGGAARAVCAAILDEGFRAVKLCNRNQDRAKALATDMGGPIEVVPWEARTRALESVALLVNTTTLGMIGHPPLDLALDALPADALVTDIVYNPMTTQLLKNAEERGNLVVDGLGMLLHQARPGFTRWFGVDPEVTEDLREFVVKGLVV